VHRFGLVDKKQEICTFGANFYGQVEIHDCFFSIATILDGE
jgi:hypothetical protein